MASGGDDMKQRLVALDGLRALAVVAMVFGHVLIWGHAAGSHAVLDAVSRLFDSFRVPMLMLVSGYLAHSLLSRPIARTVDRDIHLAWIYMIWLTPLLLLSPFGNEWSLPNYVGNLSRPMTSLWFLWVLGLFTLSVPMPSPSAARGRARGGAGAGHGQLRRAVTAPDLQLPERRHLCADGLCRAALPAGDRAGADCGHLLALARQADRRRGDRRPGGEGPARRVRPRPAGRGATARTLRDGAVRHAGDLRPGGGHGATGQARPEHAAHLCPARAADDDRARSRGERRRAACPRRLHDRAHRGGAAPPCGRATREANPAVRAAAMAGGGGKPADDR